MDYANASMTAVQLGGAAVSTEGDQVRARTGALVSGSVTVKVATAETQRKQSRTQVCVEDVPSVRYCIRIVRHFQAHGIESRVKLWSNSTLPHSSFPIK